MLEEDSHKVLVVCVLLAITTCTWIIYYEPSTADYHFAVTSSILVTTTDQFSLCDNSSVCDGNAGRFSPHVEAPLNVPIPRPSKSVEYISNGPWTRRLQDILTYIDTDNGPVSVVAANYAYRDVLINWLITAKVKLDDPLQNVIVLSLDLGTHKLMNKKGIASIYVPIESIMNITRVTKRYQAILIVRLTVLRMINYWGYDVAHYDADAIVLKNPQSLYKQYAGSDVVGSTGIHPKELSNEWGFTLCMGAIMFRSTQQTGNDEYSYKL